MIWKANILERVSLEGRSPRNAQDSGIIGEEKPREVAEIP